MPTKVHFLRGFGQNSDQIRVKGGESQKEAMFLSFIVVSVAYSVLPCVHALQTIVLRRSVRIPDKAHD
jgi:hypothetical protein